MLIFAVVSVLDTPLVIDAVNPYKAAGLAIACVAIMLPTR